MKLPLHTPLTDAHSHLQDPRLQPMLPRLLDEAHTCGIARWIVNATSPADWDAVQSLAATHPGSVIPSYGIHPWHADAPDPGWRDALEDALHDPRACVGETGMDNWITPRDPLRQERLFRAHLEAAITRTRPVTVHALRADDAVCRVLKAYAPLPVPVLIHAFGGSLPQLEAYMELGCYVSFSAATLAAGRRRARAACAAAWAGRILVETDAPDMCPPAGDSISNPGNVPRAHDSMRKRGRSAPSEADGERGGVAGAGGTELGDGWSRTGDSGTDDVPYGGETGRQGTGEGGGVRVDLSGAGGDVPAGRGRIWELVDEEGRRMNHPANLVAGVAAMAGVRGCPFEAMTRQLAENSARFLLHLRVAGAGDGS